MKQLEKDQLIDLVFDKCVEIVQLNAEKIKESILNDVKEAEDNWNEMLVKFVIAYGNEMRRECCQTFAEILHEVLYS
ncbi:MAG: hypothetical protein K2P07_00300, partial [Lachnospiraceae bacterium]|nr:hypothetical protein [Lachnospiraceae bacterium]